MLLNTLTSLAEWHLHLGLIGIDEFVERVAVAEWLNDQGNVTDPREPQIEKEQEGNPIEENRKPPNVNAAHVAAKDNSSTPDYLEYLWSGWYFTRQDADPYPSTPHGHEESPDKKWPKLNPYTGRVFSAKHKEDQTRRLTKKQMKVLWGDQKFRDFCRSHVLWYMEAHPYHTFSVRHPLRFPIYR